jgi:hypothetical protein
MEHPPVANQVLSNESQAIPAIQVSQKTTRLGQDLELWVIESLTECLRNSSRTTVGVAEPLHHGFKKLAAS